MPEFATAEDYVAFRVFKQRLDSEGRTWWEVVDRFRTEANKIVGEFDTEDAANEARDAARERRVREVLGAP